MCLLVSKSLIAKTQEIEPTNKKNTYKGKLITRDKTSSYTLYLK